MTVHFCSQPLAKSERPDSKFDNLCRFHLVSLNGPWIGLLVSGDPGGRVWCWCWFLIVGQKLINEASEWSKDIGRTYANRCSTDSYQGWDVWCDRMCIFNRLPWPCFAAQWLDEVELVHKYPREGRRRYLLFLLSDWGLWTWSFRRGIRIRRPLIRVNEFV